MPTDTNGVLPQTATVTIASGESLSGVIELRGCSLSKIIMPSTWTAANITFQISCDGTTYADLYDENGNEITLSVAASRAYKLPIDLWCDVRWLKIRSGTGAVPVNQAADRILTLNMRSYQ